MGISRLRLSASLRVMFRSGVRSKRSTPIDPAPRRKTLSRRQTLQHHHQTVEAVAVEVLTFADVLEVTVVVGGVVVEPAHT
ncbi:hypothetical protein EMPG_13703 [Blastomyces silverae]|uniref:Uncharacterized protein n=1 Tax=Blastomyces silverae TaxID=2060906 RepID=A0A0H1BHM7_9EURO|nr:hypothetical protein EMPG_13703 [Blastomyces silverae]